MGGYVAKNFMKKIAWAMKKRGNDCVPPRHAETIMVFAANKIAKARAAVCAAQARHASYISRRIYYHLG
jgi:hypothetical protein